MNFFISAIGFEMDADQHELIEKKLARVKYAEDLITDLTLKVKEDKKYIFDVNINFRWGVVAHVSEEDYDFATGVNKLLDIIDQKVKKEKDKIQEKK